MVCELQQALPCPFIALFSGLRSRAAACVFPAQLVSIASILAIPARGGDKGNGILLQRGLSRVSAHMHSELDLCPKRANAAEFSKGIPLHSATMAAIQCQAIPHHCGMGHASSQVRCRSLQFAGTHGVDEICRSGSSDGASTASLEARQRCKVCPLLLLISQMVRQKCLSMLRLFRQTAYWAEEAGSCPSEGWGGQDWEVRYRSSR